MVCKTKGKGTVHKHCTLVLKYPIWVWYNNSDIALQASEIKEINGWQMVGTKFFTVRVRGYKLARG